MAKVLENRFYYLDNFHTVLEWIGQRYSDLLTTEEQQFIGRFPALPKPSQALLVRMVMRKGNVFRQSKLAYDEIGCAKQAAHPLLEQGWIKDNPLLTLEQLFTVLKKNEITTLFRPALENPGMRKAEQLDALRAQFTEPRPFANWHPDAAEPVYELLISPLCERLRLMFFGNLRQDWSEFVLSELGIFQYEKVAFSASSRGFGTRRDVDHYLHLHRCRERFHEGDPPEDILAEIDAIVPENAWIAGRRARLLFQIAQHYERTDELAAALKIYRDCNFPGARIRTIRVLERLGEYGAAAELAASAANNPESEAEKQQLLRMLPRLERKLGRPKLPAAAAAPTATIDLLLPKPDAGMPFSVELLAGQHLAQDDAPVYYVENTLINSLFGLLCWNAVFAALPGAFFHPFHSGPADLYSPDFHLRRKQEFADCLSLLDSDRYKEAIRQTFREKAGIQSPFVVWGILSEELLELALACLPPAHLRKWFERILLDIRENCTGFPDLIQFWLHERRYRMIEIKGPGDRLQDNQIRFLSYCAAHDMPVAVCYVQWMEQAG